MQVKTHKLYIIKKRSNNKVSFVEFIFNIIIMLRKVKYFINTCVVIILYNLFYFTFIQNYTSNNMLRTVFVPQCSAVDLVYDLFDVYVG